MQLETNSSHQKFSIVIILVMVGGVFFAETLASDTARPPPATPSQIKSGYAPIADPMAPIIVGPREVLGKESLGEKAVAGVIGGLIGGSKNNSGGSSRPRTRRDPARKLDYTDIRLPGGDEETAARALWTDDGLLVSTRIEESPDHGTFQTLFLQSCDGRRMYPERYDIYKLWTEQSVSVSWSKTITSDGRVVSQESGAWNDSWTQDFGTLNRASDELPTSQPAIWQQLGFDRAQGGVRQLGAYFNLSPPELAELGNVALFVHTTLPGQDPVATVASNWMVNANLSEQALIISPDTAVDTTDSFSPTAWQDWSQNCEIISPLFGIAAASMVQGGQQAQLADATTVVQTGYPAPPGLVIGTPISTGRTTGHIADIEVRNDGAEAVEFPVGPLMIPASGEYQDYVVPQGGGTTILPGTTQTVPIEGYCSDVRKPPVPEGGAMPLISDWIVPVDSDQSIPLPASDDEYPPGRALVPGTDVVVPRAIDPSLEPLLAAPLLFEAIREIEQATEELQQSGHLQTPFSSNPERERESVIQQTFWIYAAELAGRPYTKEEFTERLEAQYEERSGVAIIAAPEEDQERLEQGANAFWDAFELVGVQAKIVSQDESVPVQEEAPATEVVPKKPATPLAEAKPIGCSLIEDVKHTPKKVDVKIADSWGNEDDRKKIRDGIQKSVESEEDSYTTEMPPATAYAIWGHDHVGGISSGYAKTVFLKQQGQDWVWTTEPLSTAAKGTGTHTLSFVHGPECTAVVAGASLMWFKATSNAHDPLEKNIEAFRILDKVKEESVKYAIKKLPPLLKEATEAGVDAITDPASDTYAAATGSATLTVGSDKVTGEAVNRVVYKRVDKEDKAIVGGGITIKKLTASDVQPDTLTSKLDAAAKLEAGATGNGFAKAYLESLYGTILVGVCVCPTFVINKVLTDNGQFIRSDYSKQSVERAMKEMQEAAERIGTAIKDGKLEPTGEKLKERAEKELQDWGSSIAGDRFKSVESGE